MGHDCPGVLVDEVCFLRRFYFCLYMCITDWDFHLSCKKGAYDMPIGNQKLLLSAWPDVLERLKTTPGISSSAYSTFLAPIVPKQQVREGGMDILVLESQTSFLQNFLNTRYCSVLRSTLKDVSGIDCDVRIVTPGDLQGIEDMEGESAEQITFNPKYIFDSFVVGNSNRFAHAACLAVAEAPAMAYNPLFIYGGVGLGKTHLLHAIGQYVLERSPQSQVLYVSSEKFTNEFIHAIQTNTTERFRQRYRNVDVLLLDDAQFLVGKERTQEEMFHTFNALHDAQKQLIFSSDRQPRQIDIEDRLRSRFQWGLIADIQAPDLETRIAILHKKADMEHLVISDDVYEFIALRSENNIRELEGALNRAIAYSRVSQRRLDMDLVQEALKDMLDGASTRLATPETIISKVSEYFSVDIVDLRGKSKQKELAIARQVTMYLIRELTDLSLPEIGKFLGRDHSTVLYGWRTISTRMATDHELRVLLADMREELLGH